MTTATKRPKTKSTGKAKATKPKKSKKPSIEDDAARRRKYNKQTLKECREILAQCGEHVNLDLDGETMDLFELDRAVADECFDYLSRVFKWGMTAQGASRITALAAYEFERVGGDLDSDEAWIDHYRETISPTEYGFLLAYRAAAKHDRDYAETLLRGSADRHKPDDAAEIDDRVNLLSLNDATLNLQLQVSADERKAATAAEGGCALCS